MYISFCGHINQWISSWYALRYTQRNSQSNHIESIGDFGTLQRSGLSQDFRLTAKTNVRIPGFILIRWHGSDSCDLEIRSNASIRWEIIFNPKLSGPPKSANSHSFSYFSIFQFFDRTFWHGANNTGVCSCIIIYSWSISKCNHY